MSNKLLPIQLRGARENNLKNIDLDLFPGQLTVITGLSGSGKSTLLFDVLHAEGQRRYVETFSPYVRQFMESLPRPKIDSMTNARPSIAVEQKNTIKNSRSTVGTMTELCDYFKVWFSQVAQLHDPDDKGKILKERTPTTQAKSCLSKFSGKQLYIGFNLKRGSLTKNEFLKFLISAGHARIFWKQDYHRIEDILKGNWDEEEAFVVVDRILVKAKSKNRLTEAITLALKHGKGLAEAKSVSGKHQIFFYDGIFSVASGKSYLKLSHGSFSFNSPVGACPECKGFGRIIEIDPNLVVPDSNLSIKKGAIKPFEGKVYGHCLEDLLKSCKNFGIDPDKPWKKLSAKLKSFIWDGDPSHIDGDDRWYGIHSFFKWLQKKSYKMHVRVFLSKYRGYFECPGCAGTRFKSEPQLWKWKGYSLPQLYALPISELLELINGQPLCNDPKADLPLEAIRTRLGYLQDVGLDYLSLDRSSRSLSGGETQRINLTACLGAGLTDTLFALDEPTIGLHNQDVNRLIKILRGLASGGNCVCVVEHDDQVIKAADKVIEIGPEPGVKGGAITFSGSVPQLLRAKDSKTGLWLSGRAKEASPPTTKLNTKSEKFIKIRNANIHNLKNFRADLPLGKFTSIAGLSGSGKSTLLHDLIYPEIKNNSPSGWLKSDLSFSEVVMIDQGTIGRSSRSNPALYSDAWNPIKEAFGRTDTARMAGFSASDFSFNAGQGRCDTCQGLGYETVEMQFLPDLSVPCKLCEGRRFKDELLSIKLDGLNVADVLELTINEALPRFAHLPKTKKKLSLLCELGLGYLKMGQPLSTLSGGESQRLKLAKYMGPLDKKSSPAILLLDEPTTGLHLSDVQCLINCLRKSVSNGHTLFVIEHHISVLKQSDWVIELGPGAGKLGGKIVAEGPPHSFYSLNTPTGRLFNQSKTKVIKASDSVLRSNSKGIKYGAKKDLLIQGARENNLKDIDLKIPSNQFVVVSGPSGSGKSSLAFDVIFAEGQRRFLESMSSYARQFVEQIGRPKVDQISGISPTVAIQQRVNRGSKKSTVGSITEIAQYLRLLYARLGVQHSPKSGKPLVSSTPQEISRLLAKRIQGSKNSLLLAPLVTNRKGHHKPLVNWANEQGFEEVRCDGKIIPTQSFQGLDRYSLHDVEVVVNKWNLTPKRHILSAAVNYALKIGQGRCAIELSSSEVIWFSTRKYDPATGKAYPDLEPSLLSWNSPRGWCSSCRGYGKIYDWMKEDLPANGDWWRLENGQICPACQGDRLSKLGKHVFLKNKGRKSYSLPQLLSLTPNEISCFLQNLLISKEKLPVLEVLLPDILDRLKFMGNVGLEYLSLNRETASLSGGESQRIRLASQLGSNLSGVLYILDEPSIGLHPSDNQKLIDSLRKLQAKGNSLIVVEHDVETIGQADYVIEIGPLAGEAGGRVIKSGKNLMLKEGRKPVKNNYLADEIPHPIRGNWRTLPSKKNSSRQTFLELSKVRFRNLQNLALSLPTGRLVVCCGVSGAGKSSLIRGALFKGVKISIQENESLIQTDDFQLKNGNIFAKAIEVTQKPIGKTSRSTPVTYLGVWTRIRELISNLPEAKARGIKSSDFSFNVKGGRCEVCKGAGKIKLEMNFLPDSYVECDECKGKRYKDEFLDLKWRGKDISEILDLTFEEALDFFSFDELLKETFSIMQETGLGYLRLGQTSPTLSGGEAQRLKLSSELSSGIELKGRKSGNGKKNFYVLEEPTIGLHPKDILKLIQLLHRLVEEGHTVVVIEHDVELIAEADYLIELGPKGGQGGGKILHQGTVLSLLKKKRSPTAKFVKKVIKKDALRNNA